jgi:hypothetical protein
MAVPLSSRSSVERLQKIIEFSSNLIPSRGLELISNPEQKTKVTVLSCGLFRWQRLNDDGKVVDYFGMTAAGAALRYGSEPLRKAFA